MTSRHYRSSQYYLDFFKWIKHLALTPHPLPLEKSRDRPSSGFCCSLHFFISILQFNVLETVDALVNFQKTNLQYWFSSQYDVREGQAPYGKGGEYALQTGFAPTIGAILRLIELYPADLRVMESENNEVLQPVLPTHSANMKAYNETWKVGPDPVLLLARQTTMSPLKQLKQALVCICSPQTTVEPQRITTMTSSQKQVKNVPRMSDDKNCQSFTAAFSLPALLILMIFTKALVY